MPIKRRFFAYSATDLTLEYKLIHFTIYRDLNFEQTFSTHDRTLHFEYKPNIIIFILPIFSLSHKIKIANAGGSDRNDRLKKAKFIGFNILAALVFNNPFLPPL
jgi:hypothetical protein